MCISLNCGTSISQLFEWKNDASQGMNGTWIVQRHQQLGPLGSPNQSLASWSVSSASSKSGSLAWAVRSWEGEASGDSPALKKRCCKDDVKTEMSILYKIYSIWYHIISYSIDIFVEISVTRICSKEHPNTMYNGTWLEQVGTGSNNNGKRVCSKCANT